jgi:rubrerythrin
MAFSEDLKRQVKEKAAFRCCRCQLFGIEVHHIIPEAEGGVDTIENGAPLCPSCHAAFGDNPKKRREITHARDWWYGVVERMYPGPAVPAAWGAIDTKLDQIQHEIRDNQGAELRALKEMLKKISNETIDGLTPQTATTASSFIVNAYDAASSLRLGDRVHANVICRRCGTRIGLLVGTNSCPNCGATLA